MKILVMKYRALGDSVIGLSSLQYLRSCLPQAELIYGMQSWVSALYTTETRWKVWGLQLSSFLGWLKAFRDLYDMKPDLIIELHQSGRSGKLLKFYSWLTRTPYFFHNHNVKEPTLVLDQGVPKASIQRDLDGVYSFLNQKKLITGAVPNYFDFPPFLLTPMGKRQRIILGIVATRQDKMWPREYFQSLIEWLVTHYSDYEIEIPISSSDSWAYEVESFCPYLRQIPLSELGQDFSQGGIYFGNDTGLKHIAAACGLPTLTLFGPERPREWHPYHLDRHPLLDALVLTQEKSDKMSSITVEMATSALKRLLDSKV